LKKYKFSLPPQYSGLDKIIKSFQVGMILYLETPHPQLIMLENRKTMIYGKTKHSLFYKSRRFYPTLLAQALRNLILAGIADSKVPVSITNDRSLLYIFNDYFTEALLPYFYTETDSEALKGSLATDYK
ncbi:PREDICTED: tripartite motif-containing protein 60-like, partial [Galeopterus variegatus]|uniref:Tripartite motif-containing protein 60-like n=1 Tax=Galeopterus variegatus TaxID=482537 RepID=A0ABM0QZA0_GALVR